MARAKAHLEWHATNEGELASINGGCLFISYSWIGGWKLEVGTQDGPRLKWKEGFRSWDEASVRRAAEDYFREDRLRVDRDASEGWKDPAKTP